MPIGAGSTLGGRRLGWDIPKNLQNPDDPDQVLDIRQNQVAFGRGVARQRKNRKFVDPSQLGKKLIKKKGIKKVLVGSPPKLRSVLSGGGASPSSVLGG